MPDINDPIRMSPAQTRADALINAAETEIRNKWTGRSWSDIGASVYNAVAGWATSASALKVAVNFATGGLVDRVASMTGLDKLGEHWSKEALKQVWALLEDDLKGFVQSNIEERSSKNYNLNGIQSLVNRVRSQPPPQNCDEIMEKAEAIKLRFAELHLRAATLDKVVTLNKWRYCDDVHYAMRELAHAELCKQEVMDDTDALINLCKAIQQRAGQAIPNAQKTKDDLKLVAKSVVDNQSTVQHKMHQNFGVVGAVWNMRTAYSTINSSCSKEKCFGPKP